MPRIDGYTVKPKLTPAQRDEIKERYADGEEEKALALEFRVSSAAIRYYVEARAVPRRKKKT